MPLLKKKKSNVIINVFNPSANDYLLARGWLLCHNSHLLRCAILWLGNKHTSSMPHPSPVLLLGRLFFCLFFSSPWVIDFDNLVASLLTVNNLLVRSTTQGCIISFCSIQLELLWGSFPIMYSVGQTSRLTLQFFIIY